MVDNVESASGSGGPTFATDDISDVHYPRVKLTWGADGTANDTDGASGKGLPVQGEAAENAAATGNPVQIGGRFDSSPRTLGDTDVGAIALAADGAVHIDDGGNSLTVDGTVTANLGATDNAVLDAIQAAVEIMDDWDETNRAAVNLISGQAGVAGGSGTVGATTQRVVLATDVALPAGTNAIGKLAANSGVDIGDVDVTSLPRGSSHYRNIDANAEDEIKGSAGTLYWIHAMNLTAAKAYLHLYDATAANVTPGTTVPDFTFALPTQGDTNGAGFTLTLANGQAFANGLTLVCTTTLDGSAGDPGTNGVIVNIGYA